MTNRKLVFFSIILGFILSLTFAMVGIINYVNQRTNVDVSGSASAQIVELKEELVGLYVSKSDFEFELDENNSKITVIESEQTGLQSQLDILELRLAQLQEDTSTGDSDEITDLQSQIDELKTKHSENATEIDDLKSRATSIEEELSTINSKIASIENQIDLLTDLVNDLKNTGNMVPEKQQLHRDLSVSEFAKDNNLLTMSTNGYVVINLCSNMAHFYVVFSVTDENNLTIYSEMIENYTQGYEIETRVFPMKKGWKINIGTVGADFSLYWGTLTIVEAN